MLSSTSSTSTTCYPSWHATFAPLVSSGQATLTSGCRVNSAGNVPCKPEAMRASAETQLRQRAPAAFSGKLSLDAYTLARYMESELGSGTIEERVAIGEAAVNRAKRQNMSVSTLLLSNPATSATNRGWYGPIHGVGTGTSTAPYGRWAATSADPTVLTTLLAILVMSGGSGNFSRDADDQDGPEYWIPQGATALANYVRGLAAKGKYWVGPLPGVDPWKTFLQFTPGISAETLTGQLFMQRGIQALSLPAQHPDWPASMPICAGSSGSLTASSQTKNVIVGVAVAGSLVGLSWLALRVAKSLAVSTASLGRKTRARRR